MTYLPFIAPEYVVPVEPLYPPVWVGFESASLPLLPAGFLLIAFPFLR